MYSMLFDLINNEINNLINITLELRKIEIRGNKVKLVFLDRNIMKVITRLYEFDWFNEHLEFKREYTKDYTDKYFR